MWADLTFQHLGRAKDASEFVKHGAKEAIIDIELARGPPFKKNPVIRRIIKFEGNKSTFFIDGKDATRKQVLKLAQNFSIQIDNLCQFLPQDKVSEFAALTPIELLYSTQRAAAGPQMIEWHDDLKRLRSEQKKLLADNKGDRDVLANLESRQESQRADVERVRERAQIKRRIEILEYARPMAAYKTQVPKWKAIRDRKHELDAELQQLKNELAPMLATINGKQEYFGRTDDLVKFKRREVAAAERSAKEIAVRLDGHDETMKNLSRQIDSEKKNGSNYKQQQSTIQQSINRINRQMEDKPEEFDIDAYNEKIVSSMTRFSSSSTDYSPSALYKENSRTLRIEPERSKMVAQLYSSGKMRRAIESRKQKLSYKTCNLKVVNVRLCSRSSRPTHTEPIDGYWKTRINLIKLFMGLHLSSVQ